MNLEVLHGEATFRFVRSSRPLRRLGSLAPKSSCSLLALVLDFRTQGQLQADARLGTHPFR